MRRRPAVLLLSLLFSGSGPILATQIDGMNLSIIQGPGPEEVTLQWTGGQPDFTIYRSPNGSSVVAPGNQIGVSSVRTWVDSSSTQTISYYEITSPCVYAPPEICDGADNDCDGDVDEPGSEASCSLPNAVPRCTAGACAIAQCSTGFGDCNGAATDGCETHTDIAQSNSPESLWAGDPNPNKDLAPGYLRVGQITNCGACGGTGTPASCDDGIACTTDLCAPVAGNGVCRHFNRSQCGGARCGGAALPPGTPQPQDPGCTGADSDGDGLGDSWETPHANPYSGSSELAGVDLDCDGVISDPDGDLIWHEAPDPGKKDIYIEYDYMVGDASEPAGHAPLPESVAAVVSAFTAEGISVHVDPNHGTVPHHPSVYFPVQGPDSCATPGNKSFYDLKIDPNNFDSRRNVGYHYFIFAHGSCSARDPNGAGTTGMSEIFGNDGMVTLGAFDYTGTATQVKDKRLTEESGTFMHEIGHNLGLCHDGASDPNSPSGCPDPDLNYKPNHISSMNYYFQLGGILRAVAPGTPAPGSPAQLDPNLPRRVDYSHGILNPLDESHLDEGAGLGLSPPPFDRDITRYFCAGSGGPVLGSGAGAIDWNCDGLLSSDSMEDINGSGTLEVLQGSDEWGNLDFKFQCQPTFADGAPPAPSVARDELTLSEATRRRLRADATAYCDPGFDDCDGLAANGCETPVSNDPDNCGGCGQICSSNNINRTCSMGVCLGSCDAGFSDCNSDKRTDGCETNIDADPANCGACGLSCAPAGDTCQGGMCGCGGGAACDALFCTLGATCGAGTCTGGAPRDCGTGNTCSMGSCNEATRNCDVSCTTAACWSTGVAEGAASAPGGDSAFNPPQGPSRTYFAKGSRLYAFRNTHDGSDPPGSMAWEWDAPASTISNFPSPVPLSSGGSGIDAEFLFVGGSDGQLYKVRASDGSLAASADLRRASCPSDKLLGTPAVQLYRFSDPNFRNSVDSDPVHAGQDLIFVITRTQCGDLTRNTIRAYWAGDLTLKWTFNGLGDTMLAGGSEGCSVDYASNTIYCGTDLPGDRNQNTLFAIDTTSGSLRWSHNAGPIQNRPMLAPGQGGSTRLYVANAAGAVQAYDPNGNGSGGGLPLWTQPVAVPGKVTANPWVKPIPDVKARAMVMIDSLGVLHAISDDGSHGSLDWSVTGGSGLFFKGTPVVLPNANKLYVGRSDGKIQQLDFWTGAKEGVLDAGEPGDPTVYDPSLDVIAGFGEVERLSVATGATSAGSRVKQFCVPFSTATLGRCYSDSDCIASGGPCAQGLCNLATGVCYSTPAPDGASCNDGRACSAPDVCESGVCRSNDYSNCQCVNPGDQACSSGQTCCGRPAACADPNSNCPPDAGCVDLNSDPDNCGSCGTKCGQGGVCTNGYCTRGTGSCLAPGAPTLAGLGPVLTGADAVAFDLPPASVGICSAYVSTYSTTGSSSVKKVDPSGGFVQAFSTSPDHAPLGGVDTVREGDLVFATMVNRPTGEFPPATPGMVTGAVSSGSLGVAATANPTSGTGPFSDPHFNQGPVGPAIDYQSAVVDPNLREAYYGNWLSNGDLYDLRKPCLPCSWTADRVLFFSNPAGERITAIAFGLQRFPAPLPTFHRTLFVAHGTTISFIDLDAAAQSDMNLATAVPPPGVSAILSVSPDPYYRDLYVEVKKGPPVSTTAVLMIREDDHSIHRLCDVNKDQKVLPVIPSDFSNHGRIVVMPDGNLLRFAPRLDGIPPPFDEYRLCQ